MNASSGSDEKIITKRARLIAFYLPQYHPIPENDEWWGKGFTEWTNVAKAKPLFRGHYQPHIPADLGFYDLRVPESRIAQAQLAKTHGIEGFCYWHYWFGGGKRLLERPFNEVLKSGVPDFPFCLGWANETWSGIWHGTPDKILIKQTYPGERDHKNHFNALLPAFNDTRYILIDGKPVFVLYKPELIPEQRKFTDTWRKLAVKSGLKGMYFIGITPEINWDPNQYGYDASCLHNPGMGFQYLRKMSKFKHFDKILSKYVGRTLHQTINSLLSRPEIFEYRNYIKVSLPELSKSFDQYPCVVANWDNTPRSKLKGVILNGSTPELFEMHVKKAIGQVVDHSIQKRIVFLKSWNEWAEGNYLEPEQNFGKAYLKAIKKLIISDEPMQIN